VTTSQALIYQIPESTDKELPNLRGVIYASSQCARWISYHDPTPLSRFSKDHTVRSRSVIHVSLRAKGSSCDILCEGRDKSGNREIKGDRKKSYFEISKRSYEIPIENLLLQLRLSNYDHG